MAQILYTYKDGVYVNLTNLCNCRCTFCVRFQHKGIGDAPTLWHKVNPTWKEVKAAVDAFDFTGYQELVFCGYGEPTCALDLMLKTAKYVRQTHPELKLRVNTNGLGSLENGRDIVPELASHLDAVSISLNAPDEEDYNKVTRPTLPGAYQAMLTFAKECKEKIPDTRMTVVDVLTPEQIEASRKVAESCGIKLRVRHFS
ncbi:MAG: TIGR04100 family radical SAM protein [Acidaminococcus sp.]|jgi:radical SAM enzyme (TIGR04100 family)|nr:TIGR04100 family radical SAM protein [Acidaminococcus sp.]MCI2100607.1 TIGR04100 family radical SAM protein [Acidaminococcus sp.]MCI2114928.1 TIGR04100 family radical SAM protein [Acidaminococcus sp.]MCI2116954.1 TIGR04100 family radical SAM protein [Acidaminococcus sp.]